MRWRRTPTRAATSSLGQIQAEVGSVCRRKTRLVRVSAPRRAERTSERVVTLAVGGMSCKRCADWVARALTDVPGVQHVDVALKTHVATVRGAATGEGGAR